MIGTRAPSTSPAPSAPAKIDQLLGQHVAGFEIGHEQDVGLARDRRDDPLIRAASGLIALSKASGPSTSAPVIWPRAAMTSAPRRRASPASRD